jgi:hypothetical protein
MAIWATWVQLLSWSSFFRLHDNDFARFYESVRSWREGGSLYRITAATWFQLDTTHGMHFWNLNPPHFSLIVWPFALLPMATAYSLWCGSNVAAFIAAAEWTRREVRATVTGSRFWFFAMFVLVATPTLGIVATGQFTGWLTLLVTAIWSATRRGHWTRAGAWTGLAWSIKLFFLPVLVWFALRRQWRAAATALAVGSRRRARAVIDDKDEGR